MPSRRLTLGEAVARFGGLSAAMAPAAQAALYQEAHLIVTNAKKLCPWDTGNLRASLHVEDPVIERSGSVACRLGAGGPGGAGNVGETNKLPTPYAVRVHEDLRARHRPGTQAKFLETPFTAARQGFDARVGDRIWKAWRKWQS